MNQEIAERIASVVTQSSFILDSFLNELRGKLSPDEFSEYCKKFGKVMGEAYIEILAPIWKQYPELLPKKMGGKYNFSDEIYKNIYDLILSQTNDQCS
ncbi:MAG TPA: hypothetical protein VGK97_07050 [Spongiibacteraceae bacterium]